MRDMYTIVTASAESTMINTSRPLTEAWEMDEPPAKLSQPSPQYAFQYRRGNGVGILYSHTGCMKL
jgi:hypothetical protein